MYATWFDYNIITNMGAKKEVLSYVGSDDMWWFHLTSPYPDSLQRDRIVGVVGQLSNDMASRGYHSARPALHE